MARIHLTILTRDRPNALARCIASASPTLRADDLLTVLDDSGSEEFEENAEVLAEVSRKCAAEISHVAVERLHDAVAVHLNGQRAPWQLRTAPRDISPLRNAALLLSASAAAETNVFVDDDIYGFNLETTHAQLANAGQVSTATISGGNIIGTSEQDVLTRLSDAARVLDRLPSAPAGIAASAVFQAVPTAGPVADAGYCLLSGGYLAFRIPGPQVFAFPPGYNEDWLWCLLHCASGQSQMLSPRQTVVHQPPELRQPTREDVLFELAGDFIVDCLVYGWRRDDRRVPLRVLSDLSSYTPDPSILPAFRADELMQELDALSNPQLASTAVLLEYGLRVVNELRMAGELMIDARRQLEEWSADAVEKHASFALTLDAVPREAIKLLRDEGVR